MFIVAAALATAMFVMTGCDKTTAAKDTAPVPVVAQFSSNVKSVTVSVNGSASIALWGAKKPYKVQAIKPDSSVLNSESYYTYISNSTTSNATLYVRGKAKGTSTVVVQDSAGTATIIIEVKVQTIAVAQSAVTLEVGSSSSTYLSISGGIQPYSIKVKPDSTKATATIGSNSLYLYAGPATGATFLTIKDNSTPAETAQVSITTVSKMALGRSSITILAGNSDTTFVSGGTAPYEIAGYDPTKLAVKVTGSVVTFTALPNASTGTTTVTVADNTVPARIGKSVSIYIDSPYLTSSIDTLRATVGGSQASAYISGGIGSYSIKTKPDTTIAKATLSGFYVYVTAVAAGSTSVTVQDGTTPTAKTKTIPIKVTAAVTTLSATVNPVSVNVGADQQTVISGGTSPYSIQSSPSSSIATASISGATVTVHGVAAGSTSMVVKDNSSPAKTVTINITVNSGSIIFTSSGTLSFSSNVANFSATGIYNVNALTGSGAGGFLTTSSNLLVYGYKYNSSTSVDISMVEFTDASPIAAGTYVMPPITGTKSVTISYIPGLNPSSSTVTDMYILVISATATISALNTSTAQGTFSGSGLFVSNSVPDYTRTITVTNGSFNVPYLVGVSPANPADKNIESIVKKIVNSQR